MLSNVLTVLAAASLLQGAVAAGAHQHQHLHQKRALVTVIETQVDYVTTTVYLDDAAPTSYFSNRRKFTRKVKTLTTVIVPSVASSSSAVPSVTQIPKESSAAVAADSFPAPPAVSVPAAPAVVPTVAAPAPSAAAPAAPAAPASNPAPAPAGSQSRGLAYNDPGLLSRFLGSGTKVNWAYNWGQTDDSGIPNIDFTPMLWGLNGHPDTWNGNAKKAIASGSKCLFSFNEPDNGGQANLSPQAAADGHKTYMNPFKGQARIGAPAITNSGSPGEGISWLQQFFTACGGGCAVDFVNIHIYGVDSTRFLQHLLDVNNAFKNYPVFITEFAFGGSDADINTSLGHVINQIETNSTFAFVERYSYFMAAQGSLVSGNALSTYGNTFAYGS